MDKLIVHVSKKTYAYGSIRAENQNLLSTISELKTRLEKVEKDKSVNTKFDKTNGSQSLLCVTPLNKHAFQKKMDVSKREENHVVSKPVTLQTSSTKQKGTNQNKNVIKPGMYRVVTTQESQTNKTKSALSSTGMNATSRVRRPMSRDSHVAHSVLDNSKKAAKNVSVYVRKNKQKDNTSANVISNKENFALETITLQQSQAMAIMYMAMSLSNILDLVDGQPKFKYGNDNLCSACERGKSKKASHPPKLVPSDHSKLELLHMDLCGPMRVASINGKKLYSWIRIMQQFSIAQTPQQNAVVERRNRTLVEVARTMLIFSKLPEFLCAEAVATTCFTQNRSIIHTRYNKTPYELLRGRKPNIAYFHVFGSLCYPTNDRDDLGKIKPKADIGVFIGYLETSIEQMNTPSKEDLDNLFGPMFKEYYEQKSSDIPIYSATQQTQVQEDSPSTSSMIVDTHEAHPIVTTSDEQTSLIYLIEADEFDQEDTADFDDDAQFVPYNPPSHEEIESSTMAPSNV
ncbi:retrovirus-related pol polyprotein from transposon TNT 1-94 [Tanacetum coccineum]